LEYRGLQEILLSDIDLQSVAAILHYKVFRLFLKLSPHYDFRYIHILLYLLLWNIKNLLKYIEECFEVIFQSSLYLLELNVLPLRIILEIINDLYNILNIKVEVYWNIREWMLLAILSYETFSVVIFCSNILRI